jgi:DNA-directed RNA polymerase specialized sigma24 family protein
MTMGTPKARKPSGAMTWRPDAEDVSRTVAAIYQEHYRSLVRLAVLLVSDLAVAEEIVQEAFAGLHGTWRTLPGHDAALRYLRRSLIRRSRAVAAPQAGPDPDAEAGLLAALRTLPARQREVLVLRYFADLPEAEIASATGISRAAVRSHAARAMSSLRDELRPLSDRVGLPRRAR